jgi:hypothetical protein
MVTLAEELNERDERRRGRYSVKAVLLDRDKFGASPERDRRTLQLATGHNLQLI